MHPLIMTNQTVLVIGKRLFPLDIVRLWVNKKISEYIEKKYRTTRNTAIFFIDHLVKRHHSYLCDYFTIGLIHDN